MHFWSIFQVFVLFSPIGGLEGQRGGGYAPCRDFFCISPVALRKTACTLPRATNEQPQKNIANRKKAKKTNLAFPDLT